MITLINFADNNFVKKQKWNSFSAKWLGKVDSVIEYSPNDIDDVFFKDNKKILETKRGAGLWLWKPYFISKALKDIKENDFLIYCDSGAIVMRNLRGLTKLLEQSEQSVMLFEIPLIECQWTQKSVFEYFDDFSEDLLFSNQIMGTIVILKKNQESTDFIKHWLLSCCKESLLLKQNTKQSPFFKDHREDQSVLSVLAKTKGIRPFYDPTDHGKFPELYLKPERLFNLKSKGEFPIDTTFFLVVRKASIFKCLTKYYVKIILKTLRLRKNLSVSQ
jgi:hypothetical protein